MVNNDIQNANRAAAILRIIQRIVCKNNPKGRDQAGARSVNPKDIAKEMVNLRELFETLRGVVENIENIEMKMVLEDKIDTLENARRNIRDENQDIVNDRNRVVDDQAPEEDGPPLVNANDFLIVEGDGGNVTRKDWT